MKSILKEWWNADCGFINNSFLCETEEDRITNGNFVCIILIGLGFMVLTGIE